MRRLAVLLTGLALAGGCSGPEPAPEVRPLGTEGGQWRSYSGDPGSSKYSPLSAIDADSFDRVGIAWTWLSPDVASPKAGPGARWWARC